MAFPSYPSLPPPPSPTPPPPASSPPAPDPPAAPPPSEPSAEAPHDAAEPYDEEAMFAIHVEHLALQQRARHEDELDEDARYRLHLLTRRARADDEPSPPAGAWFRVVAVDHAKGKRAEGQYFHFFAREAEAQLGRAVVDGMVAELRNLTSGEEGAVKLWRRSGGGAEGDAHGRWQPERRESRWRRGDRLQIVGEAREAAAARRVSLEEALSEEVAREVLSLLRPADAMAAAAVCVSWRRVLRDEAVWETLCRREAAARRRRGEGEGLEEWGEAGEPEGAWRRRAARAAADDAAVAARWRRGEAACVEDALRVHKDSVLAMQLHEGQLLSASADHTLAATPLAGLRAEASAAAARQARGFAPRRAAAFHGHAAAVLHLHADAGRVASCSSDGSVLLWSLDGGALLRRWPLRAYCVHLAAARLYCGGEGAEPLRAYDAASGAAVAAYADPTPPLGVTSSLQRSSELLAAGNTFSASQLRAWDLRTAALTHRFHLPGASKGARCVLLLADSILVGCANGSIVRCDLRSGRFAACLAHAECVNSLHLHHDQHTLISAADDCLVKLTDLRTLGTFSAHKLKRVVYSAVSDSERLYAGCDDGVIHCFDFSIQAKRTLERRDLHAAGGFTAAQQRALNEALQASRARQDSRFM
ncbi:hypothetical protein AB1Y20_020970 [Prymnesium parvum]|uniref:F-box domain-containing protein n=1 Tax=Prymnesium parvum TaxID=97485 RepID=A0AB34JHH5_PRYPA